MTEKFKIRMKDILNDEYDSFICSLENDAVRGMRVNTVKTDTDSFFTHFPHKTVKIGYTDNGYILNSDISVGHLPEHHSGMIYMQDPGAMSALSSLEIGDGWTVLDMCSAPGGKTSQAAEKIGREGFIVANEYVPKRAKIIVSNIERLGIGNALVTSLDTEELAKMYRGVFDLVICDAPCSGEGMFRKNQESHDNWSVENVLSCAKRQKYILDNAAATVRSGGYLIYSTCTYSIEENEMTVDRFLTDHPEFSLTDVREELRAVTRDGIVFEGAVHTDLTRCRRFYPHISEGEGQFVALMKKSDNSNDLPTFVYKDSSKPLSKAESGVVETFFKETLKVRPDGEIRKVGDTITLLPQSFPIPQRSVFASGTMIGEIRGSILTPSHHFFSVYGKLFKSTVNLKHGDERVEKYLRGEEIPADADTGKGWCAILYEGATLGGGKCSDGRIKNHYPKGLRNK